MPTILLEERANFQSNQTKKDGSKRPQSFYVIKMS